MKLISTLNYEHQGLTQIMTNYSHFEVFILLWEKVRAKLKVSAKHESKIKQFQEEKFQQTEQ